MRISVNNKDTNLQEGASIAHLATQLNLPQQGVAIAVNNKMIPRKDWSEHMLQDGDNLVIIKAACGG